MNFNDRNHVFTTNASNQSCEDPTNIALLLGCRQLGGGGRLHREIKKFAEMKATVSKITETRCQVPASSRSTFLLSFSRDCTRIASTHGDHNIYISDVNTGRHLKRLEGHPRTPWCITFHPTSNNILASGCLAGHVRVWDLHGASECWRADDDQVIASLCFHPFLKLLVIASGNCIYFWDWSKPNPLGFVSTNSEIERVRYVKFDYLGQRLITGISNLFRLNTDHQSPSNDSQTVARSPTPFRRAIGRSNLSTENWGEMPVEENTPTSSRNILSRPAAERSYSDLIRGSEHDTEVNDSVCGGNAVETMSVGSNSPNNSASPEKADSVMSETNLGSICLKSSNDVFVVLSDSEVNDSVSDGNAAETMSVDSNSPNNSASPEETDCVMYSDSSNDEFVVLSDSEAQESILPCVPSTSSSLKLLPAVVQLSGSNQDEEENEFQESILPCASLTSSSAELLPVVIRLFGSKQGEKENEPKESNLSSLPSTSSSAKFVPAVVQLSGSNQDEEENESHESILPCASSTSSSAELPVMQYFRSQQGKNKKEPKKSNLSCVPSSSSSAELLPVVIRLFGSKQGKKENEPKESNLSCVPSTSSSAKFLPAVVQLSGSNQDEEENESHESILPCASSTSSSAELPVMQYFRSQQGKKKKEPKKSNLSCVPSSSSSAELLPVVIRLFGSKQGEKENEPKESNLSCVPSTSSSAKLLPAIVQLSGSNQDEEEIESQESILPCASSTSSSAELLPVVIRLFGSKQGEKENEPKASNLSCLPSTSSSAKLLPAGVELFDSNQDENENEPHIKNFISYEIINIFKRLKKACSQFEERLTLVRSNSNVGNPSSSDTDFGTEKLSTQRSKSGQEQKSYTPYGPLIKMLENIRLSLNFSTSLSILALHDKIDQLRKRIKDLKKKMNSWNGSIYLMIFEEIAEKLEEELRLLVRAEEVAAGRNSSTSSATHQTAEPSTSFAFRSDILPSSRNPQFILYNDQRYDNMITDNISDISQGSTIRGSSDENSATEVWSSSFDGNPITSAIEEVSNSEVFPGMIEDIPNTSNINNTEVIPGTSEVENYSRNTSTPLRMSRDHFPSVRFNPLATSRRFRRNLNPQFSFSSVHDVDRSNAQEGVSSPPVPTSGVNENASQSGVSFTLSAQRESFVEEEESSSDSLLENLDFLNSPDQEATSPSFANELFNAEIRTFTSDPVLQHHRVQIWDFVSTLQLPEIHDATTNLVVRRCMIHNDSSIDVSQDGEKLVALIPHEFYHSSYNNLMFGVYSLRKHDLGTCLCLWGYFSNAISVSFSPLARYVAVGAAFSRYPLYGNSGKLSVVQIIKTNDDAGSYSATNVRSFTQDIENDTVVQLESLNCVKWVPQSGVGLAIATNRGSLSIYKPTSGEFFADEENSEEVNDDDNERLELRGMQ